MFFLQEYQHVHLLWFKKRYFILVWKPNPPLCSLRCAHHRTAMMSYLAHAPKWTCGRVEYKSAFKVKAQWACAAPALHMRRFCVASALLTRAVWNGRKPRTLNLYWSPRFHVISEIFLLQQCRPCTRTSATTSNFYSHTLKKWSQMLPFWTQSRALLQLLCFSFFTKSNEL